MNKKISLTVLMLVVFAMLLTACGTPTLKVTLLAEDIHWNMSTINAKVNQPIELTLTNAGALDHNLVIEAVGVDQLVSPGETQVLNFTFDTAGTYQYICSIPGHEEAGMVGEIIVQ